ncbi:MAG: hypothetical protein OSA23_08720, partial [Rhodospirillales bacterium]|nr:hypothetical protein [Rhodospirillales bacterium]
MENYQQMGQASFEAEMGNGVEPGAAMDTACDVVGDQMAADGIPPTVVVAATTAAQEGFNEVIEQGGAPNDAFESGFEAGAAGGQEAISDDM